MSEPFIGQIQTFGFNFPPRGWALCNGALLPISSNTALFSLLGTTYGGDGRTTFALPDLRGRVAINFGQGPGLSNYVIGAKSGTESNTLTQAQMPSHTHVATTHCVAGVGNAAAPTSAVWSSDAAGTAFTYSTAAPDQAMNAGAVTLSNTGGSTSVNNMQPYLAINFSIALVGIFPSRN